MSPNAAVQTLCSALGSHPHEKNLLLGVEGMALGKQSQLGSCPAVHLPAQHQLLLPELQRHAQVIQVGVGLLRHLQRCQKQTPPPC